MERDEAAETLRRCPSVIAFDPAKDAGEAEACIHGWITLDVMRALTWWAENAPGESWGAAVSPVRIDQSAPPAAEEFLPICAWCTKVRDDQGKWELLHRFIIKFSNLRFTHGICPECMERTLGEMRGESSD
jgi:hypothetical protein